MKIPTTIRIAGVDYAIKETHNLNSGSKMCYGRIDFEQSIIEIAPQNQAHQHKCIVLWHEILHGIIKHFGLEIDKEEELVTALSKGVYQVLQDNAGRLYDMKER